jgi:hypothetical protein
MAIETLKSNTLDHAVEFINNNDVDQVWIFKHYVYLGSFLPKVFGKINYDLEQISIMLYIKKEDRLCEEPVVITKDEFFKYTFNFI